MKASLTQIKTVLHQVALKVDFKELPEQGVDNEVLEQGVSICLDAVNDLSSDQWSRINEILKEDAA